MLFRIDGYFLKTFKGAFALAFLSQNYASFIPIKYLSGFSIKTTLPVFNCFVLLPQDRINKADVVDN